MRNVAFMGLHSMRFEMAWSRNTEGKGWHAGQVGGRRVAWRDEAARECGLRYLRETRRRAMGWLWEPVLSLTEGCS